MSFLEQRRICSLNSRASVRVALGQCSVEQRVLSMRHGADSEYKAPCYRQHSQLLHDVQCLSSRSRFRRVIRWGARFRSVSSSVRAAQTSAHVHAGASLLQLNRVNRQAINTWRSLSSPQVSILSHPTFRTRSVVS